MLRGNAKWFRKQKVRFSRPRPPTAGFRRIICGSAVRRSKAHFLRTPPFPLHLHLTLSSAQSYVLTCTGEDPGFPEPALPPLGSPPSPPPEPPGPGRAGRRWEQTVGQGGCGLGPAPEPINAGRPGRRGPRPDPSRRRVPHAVAPEQDCSLLPSAEVGWCDIESDGFSGPVKWGS